MFLRQSTASQAIKLGPFVDDTDGKTAETALTIANTDIKLSKAGGAKGSKNSGGATHDSAGDYTATLDATDTNTVGTLRVSVFVSGALPVWAEFQVLEEAVYDALFAASAPGYVANAPVNVAQISGDATAADNCESFFDGTGYAGTNNVIPLVTLTATATNLTNLPAIPANWLTAAGAAADFGTEVGAAVLAALGTGTWATAIPWNAAWDAEVQSECADALAAYGPYTGTPPTAAAIRAEIDSNSVGLAAIYADTHTTIPGTLATVAGYIDTEVAAIKAKTDNLPASPAATGDVPTAAAITSAVWAAGARTLTGFSFAVNVGSINGVTLTGAGTSGNPMRPA